MDTSKLDLIRPEVGSGAGGSKASEREAKDLFGDKQRLESLKQVLHSAIILAVKVASIAMLCIFLVRVFHLAAPMKFVWLDPERLQKIDSLLFSGFLGAFVARYLNQAAPKQGDENSSN